MDDKTNFLLACYQGFLAKISYYEEKKKWTGRLLDSQDLVIFDGDTLEETLETFHEGIEEYKKTGKKSSPYHAQAVNLIRHGIEEPDFIETAREFLYDGEKE